MTVERKKERGIEREGRKNGIKKVTRRAYMKREKNEYEIAKKKTKRIFQ